MPLLVRLVASRDNHVAQLSIEKCQKLQKQRVNKVGNDLELNIRFTMFLESKECILELPFYCLRHNFFCCERQGNSVLNLVLREDYRNWAFYLVLRTKRYLSSSTSDPNKFILF